MGVGMLSTFRKLMLNLIYNKSIEDYSIQKYIALNNSTIRNIVHEKIERKCKTLFLFFLNFYTILAFFIFLIKKSNNLKLQNGKLVEE